MSTQLTPTRTVHRKSIAYTLEACLIGASFLRYGRGTFKSNAQNNSSLFVRQGTRPRGIVFVNGVCRPAPSHVEELLLLSSRFAKLHEPVDDDFVEDAQSVIRHQLALACATASGKSSIRLTFAICLNGAS
jgi:hypothetical protein